MGDLEDGCRRVGVDGDDAAGALHAGDELDRAGDAAGDDELWLDGATAEADLEARIDPSRLDDGAGGGEASAKGVSEVAEKGEVLGLLDAASGDDEHFGVFDALFGRLLHARDDLDARVERAGRDGAAGNLAVRLAGRRRGEDLVADGGELRPRARRVDVRHDVAAVGRADLVEVGRFGDVELRAVGREAGAEARGDARRERTAVGGAAHKDR